MAQIWKQNILKFALFGIELWRLNITHIITSTHLASCDHWFDGFLIEVSYNKRTTVGWLAQIKCGIDSNIKPKFIAWHMANMSMTKSHVSRNPLKMMRQRVQTSYANHNFRQFSVLPIFLSISCAIWMVMRFVSFFSLALWWINIVLSQTVSVSWYCIAPCSIFSFTILPYSNGFCNASFAMWIDAHSHTHSHNMQHHYYLRSVQYVWEMCNVHAHALCVLWLYCAFFSSVTFLF